jgi:putative hydrolase
VIRLHIEADLHTHTVASGHAFSTVKEVAEAAAGRGLKIVGITDHGINMPGGPHEYYFYQLLGIPKELAGVEILRGVEANIIDTAGNVDLPERLLSELDLVLAGFHEGSGYNPGSVEANTRTMINAIYNPYVHIISHPGDPLYTVDIERVVLAAKDAGKALEINNNSFSVSRPGSKPRCLVFAESAKRNNVLVAANSDAHFCDRVGRCDQSLQVITDAGIKKDNVINTSAGKVKDYLNWHKKALRETSKFVIAL